MRVGLGVFSKTASGMEVGTIDTAIGLTDAGAEVVIFAEPGVELPPRAAALAERVVRLDALPRPMRNARVADGAFLATKLSLSRRWARALADHPVDVVHSFSPGCVALLPRPTPVVAQSWFHPNTLVGRWRTMLQFAPRFPPVYAANVARELQAHVSDGLGYRRAAVVLANTPTAMRFLRAQGHTAECVPPSIEVPAELPARAPSDALRITFCGHPLNRPRKGLRYVLEALRHLEGGPVRVTLVGGWSEDLESAAQAARRAGVEIVSLGHVPRQRYLDLLATDTDLLAFTSLYEEWGYALFEALSQGVPALAFDLYPFFDIIDADTGLLVPPRDAAALARAIDRVGSGGAPEPIAVLESTRRRFGAPAVAARLLEVYEQAIGRRAGA